MFFGKAYISEDNNTPYAHRRNRDSVDIGDSLAGLRAQAVAQDGALPRQCGRGVQARFQGEAAEDGGIRFFEATTSARLENRKTRLLPAVKPDIISNKSRIVWTVIGDI